VHDRNRLLDYGLLLIAYLGPISYAVGLLMRGVALLYADYARLAVVFGAIAICAGVSTYLVFRRRVLRTRLIAALALILNLAFIFYSWTNWSQEMTLAMADAELVPISGDQVGILLATLDDSPESVAEIESVERVIDTILRLNGLDNYVSVRRTYPIGSLEHARRVAMTMNAHIVVWQTRTYDLPTTYYRHVTVMGAVETDMQFEPTELLAVMATQVDLVLTSEAGPGPSAIQHPATDVVAPVAAGFGALTAGRPVAAATQFRNAANTEGLPDSLRATLLGYRATALLQADRPDLALQELDAALDIAPAGQLWALKGNAFVSQRQWDSARKSYLTSIAQDPYLPLAYCGLGLIRARERQVSGAMSLYRQAIAIDPDSPAPYAFLGLAYELAGDAISAHNQYAMSVSKAGPNGALQLAADQRAGQVIENPPTAVPTATPHPTPTPTPLPSSGVYVVQSRDTLQDIALQFDVPLDKLIEINQIDNPHALSIGQILIIPEVP